MKSVLWCSSAILLAAGTAAAQNPFYGPRPLGQVQEILQLSEAQVQQILNHNEEYNRWAFEKQARIRQVQTGLVDETNREPLDPSALGIRYAEIESICREMKDRAVQYRTRNLEVLNAEQKTRLKALEDALKLASAVAEAQYGNLIGTIGTAPASFITRNAGIIPAALGVTGGTSGCQLPFGGAAFRFGDFNASPRAQN